MKTGGIETRKKEGIEIGKTEGIEIGIEIGKKGSEEKIQKQAEQLALEAAHLLFANQRVELLSDQLAQRQTALDTVTAQNALLRAEVAKTAAPRPHSSYLNIQINRKSNAGSGSV